MVVDLNLIAYLRGSVRMSLGDEEHAVHYGAGGPVAAAFSWLKSVLSGDLAGAWGRVDPPFRLVLTQAWVRANREHAALVGYDLAMLANELSAEEPSHSLWPVYVASQIREIQTNCSEFDPRTWGAASRPRFVAPEYELVLFAECGEEGRLITEPTELRALKFLMRYRDGAWFVAGFTERIVGPEQPFVP
jgi:hypothetical protein